MFRRPHGPATRPRARYPARLALICVAVAAFAGAGGMLAAATADPGLTWSPRGSIAGGGAILPAELSATPATPVQETGVVDVYAALDYGAGGAAGTGIVISRSGEILTNDHVVRGATTIMVTVVSSGRIYPASVVGTDPGADVAVLRADGASGLAVARLGDAGPVSVGEAVTGVGNAGGTGGASAAAGTVTASGQTITATGPGGTSPERLTGLIATDAGIEPGDSGGPLYDGANAIVGMDTAAGYGPGGRTAAGYAIPIAGALQVATRIESATASTATIHLGYPGFLGVDMVAIGGRGAGVAEVLDGTPAAAAGLTSGDVITAVGHTSVTGPSQLSAALARRHAGDRVGITWTTATGVTRHALVTLAQGPAQ